MELAREVARVQGQPAGKEEDSETREENFPLLVSKYARVVLWKTTPRTFGVSRWKVGRIALGARAVRTLASRRNLQTALGNSLNL